MRSLAQDAGYPLDFSLSAASACAVLQPNCMDKTIRKYRNFDEMKADEYRYWQSRPVHEHVAAVSELTVKGLHTEGFQAGCFRITENSCPF
jgi:hypothetical protein